MKYWLRDFFREKKKKKKHDLVTNQASIALYVCKYAYVFM